MRQIKLLLIEADKGGLLPIQLLLISLICCGESDETAFIFIRAPVHFTLIKHYKGILFDLELDFMFYSGF